MAAHLLPTQHQSIARDRRGAHRFRTVYRIARVLRDDDSGLWRVRNISDRGLMLATGVPVTVGERLRVALSDHCLLAGRIVWSAAGHCGVAFDEAIDAPGLLKALAEEHAAKGYRPPRLPLRVRALARGECGMATVRVTDLSQQGAGVCHDGRFRSGMGVKLLLGGGIERHGIVRWADSFHAGLMLSEPLACPDLESVRRLQSLS